MHDLPSVNKGRKLKSQKWKLNSGENNKRCANIRELRCALRGWPPRPFTGKKKIVVRDVNRFDRVGGVDDERQAGVTIQGDPSHGEPRFVDFDFVCSPLCLVLHGLMGNGQNWLSSWARWWNIPNQSQPNRGSPGDVSPCMYE